MDMKLPLVRVCADCEIEHGINNQPRPGFNKSHGQCRRHFLASMREAGVPAERIDQLVAGMSDESFCPDLGPAAIPPKAAEMQTSWT